MARWNPNKKVLDHEHSRFWGYELKDIPEPNLQRDIFPYDEVSRIDFDHKIIPIDPSEEFGSPTLPSETVTGPPPLHTGTDSEYFSFSPPDGRPLWGYPPDRIFSL